MTWRTWAAIAAIAILLALVVTLASGVWAPRAGATPVGLSRIPVMAPVAVSGAPAHGPTSTPALTAEGAVGTALYSASATWCAPTPTQCQNWGGNARLAAVNSFRFGDEPYPVRVWRGDIYADALVVSHCACNGSDGYIDLSPAVFQILAPLSRGRIDVVVEVLVDLPPHEADERMREEVRDPLPQTSTEDAA